MSMLRLDDRLLDRFRLDARIAEGGMGVVYRGRDLVLDREVAIKVVRPDAIDNAARFEREATMLATLDHPHVLRYIAHGIAHEGSPFLVVEWIEGVTLAEHVERVGLTPAESIATARRIAEALGAAHARGLVHRDIKPANVLLAGGELARLAVIDFGLVRRTGDEHRLTETGTVVGTPGYMAPEQARGERAIDARTDVFALGCVLHECLTGMPAFGGRNAAAVMARIVLCEPPMLREVWPDVPPELAQLVQTMLAKRPGDRPADGTAVARALAALPPVDGPRRRRAGLEDGATTVQPLRRHAYAVFVGATSPGGDSTVARIVAPFAARAQRLADDTIVIVLDDSGADAAADCALALHAAFPDAPIVLVGALAGARDASLAALLDSGAAALEDADMRRIFGGSQRDGVHVDGAIAAQLATHFAIASTDGAHYLTGRKR